MACRVVAQNTNQEVCLTRPHFAVAVGTCQRRGHGWLVSGIDLHFESERLAMTLATLSGCTGGMRHLKYCGGHWDG